ISMSCSDTEDLTKDGRFRAMVGTQASAGIVSLVISSIVLKRCSRLYFHVNCKIMIAAMLVLFIIHSIFITTMQRASSGRLRIAAPEDDRKIICASAQDPRRASSDIMAEISTTATSLPSRGTINRRLWVAGMYGGSLVRKYLDL
uniref:G_PROTEIN_RECEP_F3_4 domain-containing protein n=1 Tax=Haemonchus contortus TaxID=6289 RepID=A0A7I4Y4A2_HAECO